jgi:hypothetical protein
MNLAHVRIRNDDVWQSSQALDSMRQAGGQDLKSEVGTIEKRLLGQRWPAMFAEVDQGQWV